jgi:hypothetical protein
MSMKEHMTTKHGQTSNLVSASNENPTDDIAAKFDANVEIDSAMSEAVRDALAFHKRLGNSVAVWSDNKVVWIAPEEIPT